MPSLVDVKRASIADSLGLTSYEQKSLSDLEWDFFSSESGLTPVAKYSLADHKAAWYKLQLGADAPANASLRGLERAYYASLGATGKSHADLEWEVFNSLGGLELNFASIPGLALYLDSRKAFGDKAVLAYDNFDRSKNLLNAVNPSFVDGVLNWGPLGGAVLSADTIGAVYGSDSLKVVADGLSANQGALTSSASAIPLIAGTTYTISISIYPTASGTFRIGAWDGAAQAPTTVTPILNANVSTRVSFTFTPTSSASFRFNVDTGTPARAATFYIDGAQVEEGSKATPFTWGNATNLGVSESGHAWTQHIGILGISSGQAASVAIGENTATIDTGTLDHVVSASCLVRTNAAHSGQIVARASGHTDLLMARVHASTGGGWELYKRVGSIFTVVANGGFATTEGAFVTITLSVKGNTATLQIDGSTVTVYTITDAVLLGTLATRTGIRGGDTTSRFDNFSVRPVALVDGDAASVWPDLSGNYRHAVQTDATKRALYRELDGPKNLLSYNVATIETDASGWVNTGNATLTRTTASASHGTASLSLAAIADGDVLAATAGGTSGVPVTAGKVYGFTGSFRAATTARSVQVGVRWFDAAGGTVLVNGQAVTYGDAVTDGTASAVTATLVALAPTSAAFVGVWIKVTAALVGEVHYFDAAGLFDVTPVWSVGGTGGNLLSADTALPLGGSTLGTWRTLNFLTLAPAAGGGFTATVTDTGTQDAEHATSYGVDTVPVTPGQTFRVGFHASGPAGRQLRAFVRWCDAAGTPLASGTTNTPGIYHSLSDQPQEVSLSGTVPAGAGRAILRVVTAHNDFAVGEMFIVSRAYFSTPATPAWVPPVDLPNNKPVFQFDGANDLFQVFNISIPDGDWTAYIVTGLSDSNPAVGRERVLISDRAAANPIRGQVYIPSGSTKYAAAARNDATVLINALSTQNITTNARVITARRITTSIKISVDGNIEVTSTNPTFNTFITSANHISIGGPTYAGATNSWADAEIQAILMYEGAHDDVTRKRIEKALGRIAAVSIAA